MEIDRLSQKKRENTGIMLIIGSLLLLFSGGIIYGAIIVNNKISVLTFASMIVGIIISIAGAFLVVRSSYIEKLNAIGRATTSIGIGQKYKVLSTVIPDEQKPKEGRKVNFLLQGGGEVIFYQRDRDKMPRMPELGDIIILTEFDEFAIVQKE